MKSRLGQVLCVFLCLFLLRSLGRWTFAKDLPKNLESAACTSPPTIDGTIQPQEWQDAPTLSFDLNLIRIDPVATEKRACELRVMNSANALYVALRVPDDTADDSMSPLRLDSAILAFSQGKERPGGNDRKVLARGIYRDKYVDPSTKADNDDPKQDGLGAMDRSQGFCTFEWALPLDSGDPHDLQIKPGGTARWNLAYFDALQVPITKSKLGGIFGAQLDQPETWGTLHLAENVKDDGGSSFRSPAWVEALAKTLGKMAPERLQITSHAIVAGASPAVAKVVVSFPYRDPQGRTQHAEAKVFLPASCQSAPGSKHPLFFAAGYELPDPGIQEYTSRGWVVVSPQALPTNPLIRTVSPDIVLLHLARQLPWVDDQRVIIGGGSAGGWMTFLLAAESFPLAAAIPDVPPVNLGYNAAYFFEQLDIAGPPQTGAAAKVPALYGVGTLLKPCKQVYGESYEDETWFANSPVGHFSTITCPVSVYWSTADVLVPINQVSSKLIQPFEKSQFPDTFTMSMDKLQKHREGQLTLVDQLSPDSYEIFTVPVPSGTSRLNAPEGSVAVKTQELKTSPDKQWSITIIDEGPPVPDMDHRKYAFVPTRNEFLKRIESSRIATSQLSPAKLKRLMARYAGKEWLPSRLKSLDTPENERADVLRGLKTYVAAAPANAQEFAKLYAQLPPNDQVLSPSVVKELTGTVPPGSH